MVLVLVPIAVIAVALLALSLQNSSQQTTHYTLAESLRGVGGQISGWLDQIPFVGRIIGSAIASTASDLADGLDNAAHAIEAHVRAWANGAVQPLADFIQAVVHNGYVLWEGSVNAIEEVASAVDRIVNQSVPDAINTSYRLASELANNVKGESEQYADAAVQAAFAGMNQIINAQIGNVTGEIGGIGDEIAATALALENQITEVSTGLGQEIGRVAVGVSNEIQAEISRAQAAEAALAQLAHTAGADAVAEAERVLGGAIDALRTDELARDAAIAATAAAATAAVATDLTNFLDECGTEVCNNLGPLAKLLPVLLGLLEDGLLLGVVAEAFLHPEEAARAADSVLGGIVGAGRDILAAVGVE